VVPSGFGAFVALGMTESRPMPVQIVVRAKTSERYTIRHVAGDQPRDRTRQLPEGRCLIEAVWHRWVVVPAVSTGADTRETRYYEATTGWLVGKELERTTDGSKRVDVLSDTNVAIPTH
jgi:hypothetical protein